MLFEKGLLLIWVKWLGWPNKYKFNQSASRENMKHMIKVVLGVFMVMVIMLRLTLMNKVQIKMYMAQQGR